MGRDVCLCGGGEVDRVGELGGGEVETHPRGKCGNGTFAFWCPHLKRKLYCLVELNTEQLIYASSNPSNQLFRNISGDGVITYPATFQNWLFQEDNIVWMD